MKENLRQQTDYGNWVPMTLMRALAAVTVLALVLFAVVHVWLHLAILDIILCLIVVVALGMTTYMYMCRRLFSFNGGRLMEKIHEFLVSHLQWNGEGQLLDIGCGSGALSIQCAKRFPKSHIVGIDYWGKEWDYAQQQCERNAELEQVKDRVRFLHGDASHLDFPDETFDAVLSNFVFHEVKTQPNKSMLIREALRVLKPEGYFAFQDLFEKRGLYGDINELLDDLRKEGYADINYISHVERQDFVPKFVRAPWMISDVGLIYGRKPKGN
ncbi:MAG: class I SAM-dependent methyltransferase [Prevotella sp.]